MAAALSFNMRLLAHHELQGFGGIGEGMALQQTRGGRRILWLAHEAAPKDLKIKRPLFDLILSAFEKSPSA